MGVLQVLLTIVYIIDCVALATIVLMQEGKMPKMPMFLIGKSFWKPLDKFFESKMQKMGTIKASDRKIYTITDDINEVVKAANKIGHPSIHDNIYNNYSNEKSNI